MRAAFLYGSECTGCKAQQGLQVGSTPTAVTTGEMPVFLPGSSPTESRSKGQPRQTAS